LKLKQLHNMDQVLPGTVTHLWEIKNNLIGQFK